jgi:hypothetical protein
MKRCSFSHVAGELTADRNKADVIFDKASETMTMCLAFAVRCFASPFGKSGEDKGEGFPLRDN